VRPVAAELTYGLERIAMYLQNKENVYDLEWSKGRDGQPVSFGEVRKQFEYEWSKYSFEAADPKVLFTLFDTHESECKRLLDLAEPLVLPAFDECLKCSHLFNLLDGRGAISVTERARFIGRVRTLSRAVAQAYYESREKLGFPMVRAS
jgi:glycyl-tRNA synthetase alpha chain